MVWTYEDFVRDALARVAGVACEALLAASRRDASQPPLLLDIRESDEWTSGVIPGSVLLPRGLLEKHVFEHIPDREASVCVYCSTGKRSAMAADTLARMGYSQVTHLTGGIERWRHLGYPLMGGNQACQIPKGRLSWEDIRNEFAIVNRQVPILGTGSRNLVYLDHAASTHAPKTVLDAYLQFLETEYANVHRGTHLLSRRSTERFEEAYYVVADYLGAELTNGAVCFTQNTTEAIDLCSHIMAQRPGRVVTTELEHHSNELPHRTRGPVLRARVHDDGSLDFDHLETLLRHNDVKLVAVTAGSNVTGYMPDLGRIARMAHEAGALILVDGAQALARLPIRVKPVDDPEHIDFFASAGHKAYAPFGAGFLYGPRALMTEAPPYVAGGGTAAQVTPVTASWLPSPERHHGGTPNIPGVVGMARSLRFLSDIGLENVREHEVKLTRRALDAFAGMEGISVYGPKRAEDRLGVLSFNVDGVEDLMTAAVLSEEGALAVRNGRFCSHIYCDRLLKAAHPEGAAKRPEGAVRASFGLYNNESDVDRLIEFVTRVRDRQWVGRYRVRGGEVNAEFAGRCADRWMEPTAGADAADRELVDGAYLFHVFHEERRIRAYLFGDQAAREVVIVDPVREHVDQYLDYLQAGGYRLTAIVETHTHTDHLSGALRLKELTGAEILMHMNSVAPCVDRALRDGDRIAAGKIEAEVIETPGHTSDAIVLLLPGRLLTGDTLLIGDCGVVDLPNGNAAEFHESLQKLLRLPDDLVVYPGHVEVGRRASTLGRERANNPRLSEDLASFLKTTRREDPEEAARQDFLQKNQQCLTA